MSADYESIIKSIKLVLRKRYKLTSAQADEAVSESPLKSIFDMDADMAAHTSNEAWAKEVYQYWQDRREKPSQTEN